MRIGMLISLAAIGMCLAGGCTQTAATGPAPQVQLPTPDAIPHLLRGLDYRPYAPSVPASGGPSALRGSADGTASPPAPYEQWYERSPFQAPSTAEPGERADEPRSAKGIQCWDHSQTKRQPPATATMERSPSPSTADGPSRLPSTEERSSPPARGTVERSPSPSTADGPSRPPSTEERSSPPVPGGDSGRGRIIEAGTRALLARPIREILIDADIVVSMWRTINVEPGKTHAVVTEIRGNTPAGLEKAAALARAITPPLETAVRTAWAAHQQSGQPTAGQTGQVRIEMDRDHWYLVNLQPAVPVLIQAMRADYGFHEAPLELAHIGPPAQAALIEALGGPNPRPDQPRTVRMGVAEALGMIRSEASASALARLLQDPDAGLRAAAVKGLSRQESRLAVASILQATEDPDPAVRTAAIWALPGPDLKDERAMRALARALTEKEPDGRAEDAGPRWAAMRRVRGLGLDARPLLPAVQNVLAHSHEWLRIEAARVLWDVAKDTDSTVPALLAVIAQDKNDKARLQAVELLRAMGTAAEPALRRAKNDKDPALRAAADEVLK